MSKIASKVAAFALSSFVIAFALADAVEPSRYSNPEFGITSKLDGSFAVCRSEAPEHDHGFTILLNGTGSACANFAEHTFVSVEGFGNVLFAPDADSVIRWLCNMRHGRLSPAPSKFHVVGHPSASGLCKSTANWVDLFVVTETGKWSHNKDDPDSAIPYINIIVTLHTKTEELAKNTLILQHQLDALQITFPQ